MDDSFDLDTLRDSFRDVLATECPTDVVLRHSREGRGINRPLWDTIVGLGWPALAAPEAHGGLGLGLDALTVLYEELGRVVAPLPMLSTLLAAQAIATDGNDAQRDAWMPRIVAGAVLAVSPPAPLVPRTLRVEREGDVWRLTGTTTVIDAFGADRLVLLAIDATGVLRRLLVAPGDVEAKTLWDHGHTLSTLVFDRSEVPAEDVFETTLQTEDALAIHASLALAAEAVGGSAAVLAMTIEYMKTRQQFGKPIGSFQGLKHRVADHRARLEGNRMLLASATSLAVANDPLASSEASGAKAMACADYAELARDCIQLHGGIGFTTEQACHLFLKRARLNDVLFGDRERHLARAAIALGLEIAA